MWKHVSMTKIELAEWVAELAHSGQMRTFGGDPYITHPLAVAEIVKEYTADEDVISAALLHDVYEDCDVSLAMIEHGFGGRVTKLVAGVSKISNHSDGDRATRRAKDHRWFAAQCAECQLIKAADSLHNTSTLANSTDKFRKRYVPEKRELAGMLELAPQKLIERLLKECDRFDY